MIIDLAMFIILSSIIAILISYVLVLRHGRRRLANDLLRITLEKAAVISQLDKALDIRDSESVEQTDGFLKFVSESRDWAFQYIEEVQAGLDEFKSKVDLDIKYILKYGQLIEHPLQESINRIAEAYEELQKLLPTDKDRV